MNLYVGCMEGIGKTTLAKKNDMFVDLDAAIGPYEIIILNKKKEFVENLLNININNKIILFNTKPIYIIKPKEIKHIEISKNYFILNIENIAEYLKTRIKKREILKNSFKELKKEEINCLFKEIDSGVTEYIKFVNDLNTKNKIIINSIDELNNLENILLSKFEELKNAENGRRSRSEEE